VAKRAKQVTAALRAEGLTLKHLCFCLSAAERVRSSTCAEFEAVFRGEFQFDAFFAPSYGLAESVVCVCTMGTNARCDPHAGTSAGQLLCSETRPDLVCVSEEALVMIKVVDNKTRMEKPSGSSGEIWVSSESIAMGYWGKPELSDETFRARLEPDDGRTYLRTGDEAYYEQGTTQLYICGRIKDLIIIGGKNYYPEDVELSITDACPGDVRPGCVAAFSVLAADGAEILVIVFELRAAKEDRAAEVCRAALAAVVSDVGIAAGRIVAIKEKTIPKTTSGKIQRRATRESLEKEGLRVILDMTPGTSRAAAAPFANRLVPPVISLISAGWWEDALLRPSTGNFDAHKHTRDEMHAVDVGALALQISIDVGAEEPLEEQWALFLERRVMHVLVAQCVVSDDADNQARQLMLTDTFDPAALATEMLGGDALTRGLLHDVTCALAHSEATAGDVIFTARMGYAEGFVRREVAAMIGGDIAAESLDATTPLQDFGLTSQSSWELAGALERSLDVSIGVTRLLDPITSIASLSAWIVLEAVRSDDALEAAVAVAPEISEARQTFDVVRATLATVLAEAGNHSPGAVREFEARGAFPFAFTRFEDSSYAQVAFFALYAPFGLGLALVRVLAIGGVLSLTTPRSLLDHLFVLLGVRLGSRSVVLDKGGAVLDGDVVGDEPTLVLSDHHVTLDQLFIASDLARSSSMRGAGGGGGGGGGGDLLMPFVLAHEKLRSTFGDHLGAHVQYGSGNGFLLDFEAWIAQPDAALRPMVLSPTGQTTKRPFVSLPSLFFLGQGGRAQTAIASIKVTNTFGINLRLLEGNAPVDMVLGLMMPFQRALITYRVVPRVKAGVGRRVQAPAASGLSDERPLRAWCRAVVAQKLQVSPFTQRIKAKCVSDVRTSTMLNQTALARLLGARDATLYVTADALFSSAGGTSAPLLEMINGARGRAREVSTELTVVLILCGDVQAQQQQFKNAQQCGFKPDVSQGAKGVVHCDDNVAVVVITTSLVEFERLGFMMEKHTPVLVNPGLADCATAEAFDLTVLFDDSNAPRAERAARGEARANVRVQGLIRGLRSPVLSGILMISVNLLHWMLLEKHIALLGCVLLAVRSSPDLILAIAQAYALTHVLACYMWKIVIPRPRPFWLADARGKLVADYLCPRDAAVHDASFTSGHTTFATTIATCAACFGATRVMWITSFSLMALTAAARVYAGMHYVSDVCAGAIAAAVLNIMIFQANLLARQDGGSSVLSRVRPDDLSRQLGVTACLVVANALTIGLALFVARTPPRLHRKVWTENYQKQLARGGLTKNLPLIDLHENLDSMLAPFFGVCSTVFWVPPALAKIYDANRWCPYERDSQETCIALLLCAAGVVFFALMKKRVTSSTKLPRTLKFGITTFLYANLFVFNIIVIDVAIFKGFHAKERWSIKRSVACP